VLEQLLDALGCAGFEKTATKGCASQKRSALDRFCILFATIEIESMWKYSLVDELGLR